MKLIKLNSSKKKSLSPIVSVILLVLVVTVIAGFLLSFLKNSTHTKLNTAHVALKQASSLDCAQAEIYVDSCLANTNTKDINLLVRNNSNITLYGLSLSADGNSPNGPVRLVGDFNNIVKPGEYINLSTGSSDFTASKEKNLSTLDVSSIKNLTLSNLACPNKSIFIDTCETNMCNNDGICETGENETYCSYDCPSGCNLNGVCDATNGESKLTCASDCICNSDGICDTSVGETVANCSYDCPSGCNENGACDVSNGENALTCSADCPPVTFNFTQPSSPGQEFLINSTINLDVDYSGGISPYTCNWSKGSVIIEDFSSVCGATTTSFNSVGTQTIDFNITDNYGSNDYNSTNVMIYDYAVPPTADYDSGTYSSAINVALTSSTSGATIIYTTDGSEPTEINGVPQGTSQTYTGPISFNSSGTYTLKAKAFNLPYYKDSGVMTKTYTLSLPLMDFTVVGGVIKENVSGDTATTAPTVSVNTLSSGKQVIRIDPVNWWDYQEWVYRPTATSFTNTNNALTFVFWANFDNLTNNQILFLNDITGSEHFSFGIFNSNQSLWVNMGGTVSGEVGNVFSGGVNNWVQIALVFNFNDCSVIEYANGIKNSNFTMSSCTYPSSSSIKYLNGAMASNSEYSGGNYSIIGSLSDFRIFPVIKSVDDILAMYNNEVSKYT